MLILLALFGVLAMFLPAIERRIGLWVFVVAALVPAAAFVHAALNGPPALADAVVERYEWVPQLGLTLDVRLDPLSWVMALIVTGVGALVLVYCTRYFAPDAHNVGRFAGVLLAFAGAMYGLVIADDVFLLFIFWEATTVFSYLLIAHHTSRRVSRGAALQALLVTTLGGLVMLVGLVLLAVETGTSSLPAIIEAAPRGDLVTVAVLLVLVGAISKSAIAPFHFWLPAAMAAPTPVSAYLHAAAMVKAGIYLVARMAPGFAEVPGWHEVLVTLGVLTMLLGGYRSLRESDLKLVLAYGTVGQLGFLMTVVSIGTRDAALAGLALLLAHALFKSTLFLVVGIIDHRAGTRDLRKLSGLGREEPALAVIAVLAAASMAGLPPTLGFVAKEAVFASLLADAAEGSLWSTAAIVGVVAGSVLTVAYTARFVWGAFALKQGVEPVREDTERWSFLAPPALLAFSGLALGLAAAALDPLLAPHADAVPARTDEVAHLALWHGWEPALALSGVTLILGLAMFRFRDGVASVQRRLSRPRGAVDAYWGTLRGVDVTAARTTAFTQRGSLPLYLAIILLVFVVAVSAALSLNRSWPDALVPWDHPGEGAVVVVMIVAAVAAARASKRFQAVVLVGVTGIGMAALFGLHGAPDLALTQALVEIITLVAFVLVLRRLPARLGTKHGSTHRLGRALIGAAVGLTMAVVAVVAVGVRTAEPISIEFPRLAVDGGHGKNVVNVALVDLRGWDTMGELSVLIVAATGVASLIFISSRNDELPRARRPVRAEGRRRLLERLRPVRHPDDADVDRGTWLLAGRALAARNRSILLEVVVRLIFHSIIVVSVYLLFAGHNAPGGGFAGGLVAGLALVARYLAGGRYELGAAAPLDAGTLLGSGLFFAVGTALVPLFFGADALTSTWFEAELPVLGHVEFVTSTLFDVGVYLVVIGLVLDVLRSLGGEVDRQQEDELQEVRS
ncbi:multicomponent Na+:H+ antiporter subunit A [Diaminobutyricimonas aerilata]|uniref:Multicomponent Na+:H+ antiporter subunit A n=1 Tax=Diaminobutyricimonas aerilata TaxID=1162967 RepID=A0A2M9CHB5_9MICO|nr:Na+/H+ antiporter subunit A [Diaminobutyricimonas aerilata]PJJ71304.1 multicomponent Na+:H+ antiporter subunit A [Diaminobutyricimonas aerilata]